MTQPNSTNQYLLNFDFKSDSPEKYKADTAKIQALLDQHRSGEITLSEKDFNDIEKQLFVLEQRETMLKANIDIEIDTCFGEADINQLTEVAQCKKMALYLNKYRNEGIKKCLTDQIAAIHKLAMQSIDHANKALAHFGNDEIATRFNNTALKASKACCNLALTLEKIENGGKQSIEVKHQYVQVNKGGQAVIASDLNQGGPYEK